MAKDTAAERGRIGNTATCEDCGENGDNCVCEGLEQIKTAYRADVVSDGIQAFFGVVAKAYPECKTGDFPPDAHALFMAACADAVDVWLGYNRPSGARLSPAGWFALVDSLKLAGYLATLEGGGAACPFVSVQMADGSVYLLGDVNETWMADRYVDMDAVETGDPSGESIDTAISVWSGSPEKIAARFMELAKS